MFVNRLTPASKNCVYLNKSNYKFRVNSLIIKSVTIFDTFPTLWTKNNYSNCFKSPFTKGESALSHGIWSNNALYISISLTINLNISSHLITSSFNVNCIGPPIFFSNY